MVIKLEIKDKIIDYLNCYVVECEVMFGDADGYGELIIGGFEKDRDDYLLEEFLILCETMKKHNGRDYYEKVLNFDRWFEFESLGDDIYEEFPEAMKNLVKYWPLDPQTYGEYNGRMEDY